MKQKPILISQAPRVHGKITSMIPADTIGLLESVIVSLVGALIFAVISILL